MPLHGKDTEIKIDDSTGALTDLSEYCDSVDFPGLSVDTEEASGFQAKSKSYVIGLLSGTFSISGNWDAVPDALLFGIVGKAGSFTYKPGGGLVTYSGEAICTSYQFTSPMGKATFSANFQIDGDLGRA